MSKVAVVTGANTGIGFEIVRQLFGKLPSGSSIVLCSRNKERGECVGGCRFWKFLTSFTGLPVLN